MTTPSRGPERVRRGATPAPLPRQGQAAGTMSPVLSRPPCAPRSHPVKPGAQAPEMGKGTTASGKPTGAPRATGPDEGPRGEPERHAAGHNQGTRTGAKQQRPPGAANPESAHNTQRTTAQEQVPSNTSRRPDRRVGARQRTQPLPATEQPPSGWRGARPEGTQPLPATKQPPSGWTSARPEGSQPLLATNSRRPDGRVSAPQRHPAHATPHRQPTAQHTERAHR